MKGQLWFHLRRILVYWRTYLVVLVPLVLLPLPVINIGEEHESEAKCAYVALIMAIYWVVELLPLSVTALLPIVMFPLLGIMSTNEITMYYMKDTCMLFVGGTYVSPPIAPSLDLFSNV